MSKKFKIAYLCLESINVNNASYVHVTEVLEHLQKRNLEVKLFCSNYKKHNRKKKSLLGCLLRYLFLQIRLIVNIRKYSLLYVRSHYMAFASVLIAKLFFIPVIQEVNGPYDDIFITYPWLKIFKPFLIPLQRLQYKWATHILPVTDNLKEWIAVEAGHNRITVIPNGANTRLFHPNSSLLQNEISSDYVVFFGSMAKWHDLNTILKATSESAWPENVKLVILGADLIDPIMTINNNSRIILLPTQDYKKVHRYVSPAIAGLVIISNLEKRAEKGLAPLKLYETLACGVPVIATDFPGQADLIKKYKCGVVVPPNDSVSLAKSVSFLYKNKKINKTYGRNGRRIVEKKYNWEKNAEVIYFIIKKIICYKYKKDFFIFERNKILKIPTYS